MRSSPNRAAGRPRTAAASRARTAHRPSSPSTAPASIILIHWNAAEARERVTRLRAMGLDVDAWDTSGQHLLRELRSRAPAAILIDLTRLPAQGRDVGLAIRMHKATRAVPIVFVDGEPEKVDAIRRLLPDASFTTMSRVSAAVKRALAAPVADPHVPASIFDAYTGRPLATKLGIGPGTRATWIAAPPGFGASLSAESKALELATPRTRRGPLHDGGRREDVVIWFARSRAALERDLEHVASRLGDASVWIAWAKQGTKAASDLTQPIVRRLGLSIGLVDYKICALDATWAALRFRRRRARTRG